MNPNNPSAAFSTFQPHPGMPSSSPGPGYPLPIQQQQQHPQPQPHLQGQAPPPHPSQQPSFYPHPNPNNPNLLPHQQQQQPHHQSLPHANPYSQVQSHGKAPPSQMQHPVQQQHHPQQQQQLQQQQQQQHAFGARQMQTGGPSGAMMPAGMPQHQSGPPQNFSAPQYHQSTVPTTLGQQPTPQRQQSYPVPSSHQSQPQNMAAVSGPGAAFQGQMKPTAQAAQGQNPSQPAPSPEVAAREKARVTVLLNINSALLQEVINLQAAGKAGMQPNQPGSNQTSPTQDQSPSSPMSAVDPSKQNALNNARSGSDASKAGQSQGAANKPSQEYIDCMRRLQANLAYLATVADRAKKTGTSPPQGPAITTPPPMMPGLNDLYAKLNELFPNANKGGTPQGQQPQQQQPAQQQQQQPQSQPQPQPQQQMNMGQPQAFNQGTGMSLGLTGEATG